MKVLCILLCIPFASGVYIDNNETHEEKIVGGHHVNIENVPFQASLLRFRIDNFCGATIIHQFWVITASHCVINNQSHISVQTGTGSRQISGTVHRVQKIISHCDYDGQSKENDIALIKLAKPIQFNNQQQPIELAKPSDIFITGELVRISGFGRIGEFLRTSTFLKAAYIPVRNQTNCQRAYKPLHITDNMFCAGNGDADPCYGDSGGPGVIRSKLHGIISFDIECNSTTYPAVFTRVHKYYHWIEEKTELRF